MEIVFLGTGGGRVNLIKQVRATGGFRLNAVSANIHVDPGPGALLHSLRNGMTPLGLDAILITHNHVDHFSDAMVLTEGMTHYGLKKRGILIGSKYAIDGEGGPGVDRAIHAYQRNKAEEVYVALDGGKKTFETEKGSFLLESFALKHEEPTAFGFKLTVDKHVVGYISDTEYIEGMGIQYAGCDYLIVNCLKPQPDVYDGHLTSDDVIKILKDAKPKHCIITHLGLRMLKVNPTLEAKRIQEASGVHTFVARDGMRIRV